MDDPKISYSATCQICKNIFNDPRILSCGHTFCFSCLVNEANQHVASASSAIHLCCKKCQKQWIIPEEGIGSLLKNDDMNKIACSLMRSTLSHQVPVSLCDVHPDLEVTHFCKKCNIFLCDLCCVSTHSQDEAFRETIQEAKEKFKKPLIELIKEAGDFNDEISKLLKSAYDSINAEIAEEERKLKKVVEEAEEKAKKRYDEMMEAIKCYNSKAQDNIDRKKQRLINELETDIIDQTCADVLSIKERCEKSLTATIKDLFTLWKQNISLRDTLTRYKNIFKRPCFTSVEVCKQFECKVEDPPIETQPSATVCNQFTVRKPKSSTKRTKGENQQICLIGILSLYDNQILLNFIASEFIVIYNKKGEFKNSLTIENSVSDAIFTRHSHIVVITWEMEINLYSQHGNCIKKFSKEYLAQRHIVKPESLFMDNNQVIYLIDRRQGLFEIDETSWTLKHVLQPPPEKELWEWKKGVHITSKFTPDTFWIIEEIKKRGEKAPYRLRAYVVQQRKEQHQQEQQISSQLSITDNQLEQEQQTSPLLFITDNQPEPEQQTSQLSINYNQQEQQTLPQLSATNNHPEQHILPQLSINNNQPEQEILPQLSVTDTYDIECVDAVGNKNMLRYGNMVYDGKDSVYLNDSNNIVHVFSINRTYIRQLLTLNEKSPVAVALDASNGHLYIAHETEVKVYKDVEAKRRMLKLQVITDI